MKKFAMIAAMLLVSALSAFGDPPPDVPPCDVPGQWPCDGLMMNRKELAPTPPFAAPVVVPVPGVSNVLLNWDGPDVPPCDVPGQWPCDRLVVHRRSGR
jgi:hypothetical protein